MRFSMSLIFRLSLIYFEWQRLKASVLPDRRRRRPATATATGNGNGHGKDIDKSTLSQAVQGADTKEEGDEEEALDEDPGALPRIKPLGEAEGRGGKGTLNKFY